MRNLLASDRGDVIVTPAVLALVVAVTLVTAGLTYVAARNVAPGVDNARQGQQIDDEGNVVQGGVGVIPVPTPTQKPTAEPADEPADEPVQRREPAVHQTQAPVYQPTPTPYVYVSTPDPHETDEPHETQEPMETHHGGDGMKPH